MEMDMDGKVKRYLENVATATKTFYGLANWGRIFGWGTLHDRRAELIIKDATDRKERLERGEMVRSEYEALRSVAESEDFSETAAVALRLYSKERKTAYPLTSFDDWVVEETKKMREEEANGG